MKLNNKNGDEIFLDLGSDELNVFMALLKIARPPKEIKLGPEKGYKGGPGPDQMLDFNFGQEDEEAQLRITGKYQKQHDAYKIISINQLKINDLISYIDLDCVVRLIIDPLGKKWGTIYPASKSIQLYRPTVEAFLYYITKYSVYHEDIGHGSIFVKQLETYMDLYEKFTKDAVIKGYENGLFVCNDCKGTFYSKESVCPECNSNQFKNVPIWDWKKYLSRSED